MDPSNKDGTPPSDGGKRTHSIDQELARLMSPMHRGSHIDPTWRTDSKCSVYVEESDYFLDAWFAPEDTTGASIASSICFTCPVREKCLEWASATKQREGIWGGQPPSVRLKHKGKPHNYTELVLLPNPYDTDSPKSRFHSSKLRVWDGETDEGEDS